MKKRTLLTALFLFQGFFLFSQARFTLLVNASVFDGKNTKMEGAVVVLYGNGEEISRVVTDKTGKFDFTLEPDMEYLLKFLKPGYVTKYISINTKNVPPSDFPEGMVFRTSPDVELFRETEGLDVSILEQPIGKMIYNPAVWDFQYDTKYTKEIKGKLAALQKELEQKKQRQAMLLAKYDASIVKADKAFAANNYDEAKGAYKEALGIIPGELYPKEKIEAIDALQAAVRRKSLEAAAAREKEEADAKAALEAAARLMAEAEEKASLEAESRKKEEDEVKQVADEKAAKDKAIEAEAKRKAIEEKALKEREEGYIANVVKGDSYFNSKNYGMAKASYKKASELKPEEKYPKEKLGEIKKILESPKANDPVRATTEEKAKREVYISELVKKYPEGVTEEVHEEQGRKTIRRIVVKGSDANEYTKVIYSWGVYYFKNQSPISEHIWTVETK